MKTEHNTVIPSRETCVLRYMLESHAQNTPDKIFVVFHGGPSWTYAKTLQMVQARAATLLAEHVRQGDRVLCWLGNGPELLVTWFAINYIGAVYVPLNTASKGKPLGRILNNVKATLMVAQASLVGRLEGIDHGDLQRILTVDGEPPKTIPDFSCEQLIDVRDVDVDALSTEKPIEPWDTQAIMYTSGTTGFPKGVVSSYVQLYTMGPDAFDCIVEADRCMIAGPIFHCGSTLYVYAMLACGGSIAMMKAFQTAEFWDAIRETKSTVVLLLGVMANFLLKQPPSDQDTQHPLKKVFIVPFGDEAVKFRDRFHVDLYTVYNMTEIASPLSAGPGISKSGLCGQARPWFELRVADAQDQAVSPGEVGELLVRSHRPWALFSGYFNDAEATVQATRNGWFHTGDAFKEDQDNNFYFVDRFKDIIRRRGENISSFELEGEICSYPGIQEAVAIAVPSEYSEEEVLAVITPIAGASLDLAKLVVFLAERLPHYMVPRYIRIVNELPKTASGKLQKHKLRTEGLTADTWDREKAGLTLKRAL
ncbi:AMP-binding protein [Pusillimonas sp. ANT_WB101]|uniref:AMP-binding protein n=1 Tax=Pusillimonas sp. ANT_WB101 TaxID=2597356 RepID=UPI0011EC5D40|nr:AMP-binding protein [Pusillimonas sp. ANT_WB101]KAA0890790.1 AMP-binding protein [Pusillimonas sp. ANT_WB101]